MEETINTTTENTGLVTVEDTNTDLVPVEEDSDEGSGLGKLILVGVGVGLGIGVPKLVNFIKGKVSKKDKKEPGNKKFDKYYRVIQDTNGKVISDGWVDGNGNEIEPEKK